MSIVRPNGVGMDLPQSTGSNGIDVIADTALKYVCRSLKRKEPHGLYGF